MGLDGVPGVLIRGSTACVGPAAERYLVCISCVHEGHVRVRVCAAGPVGKVCGWWRERGLACYKKQCGYHVCAAERAEGAQPPGHGGQRNHARAHGVSHVRNTSRGYSHML